MSAAPPPPLVELPPRQVAAAWDFMVASLVSRRFPEQDAQDVAQDVFLNKILADPAAYADKIAHVEENRGWFATVALNAYRMRLRAEKRRRARELRRWDDADGSAGEPQSRCPDGEALLAVAAQAELTVRQLAYVRAILGDGMLVADVARVTGTSERAVRAVLQRAVAAMRRYLELKP